MIPAKWSGKMQANAYRVASEIFWPISIMQAIYMTPEWARVRMRLHLALGNDATNETKPTREAIGTFRERESQSSDSRMLPDAVDRVSINAAWPESPANFNRGRPLCPLAPKPTKIPVSLLLDPSRSIAPHGP